MGRSKNKIKRDSDKQQGITYGPGNYIQYPVTNHNGKGKKRVHYSYTSTTIIQN